MQQQSGWQLSGSAPEAYERYIIPACMAEWAQDLVEAAAIRDGERVLDVACGTGVVARQVASVTGPASHIVGLDVNSGMLDMARRVPPPAGTTISWRQGDAAAMPFPEASFDVVLCQQGLQYFPDRKAGAVEMTRVLEPGGRVAISVWRSLPRLPFFAALTKGLEHYVGADAAATLKAAFTLGEAEAIRDLLVEAGFHDVHISLAVQLLRYGSLEEFLPGYLTATPMAGEVAALDDATRTTMFDEITTALQPYMDDDGLAAPMECYVVTAHI